MIPQKPINSEEEIVTRCLNNYWGKGNTTGLLYETGWDKGSPAHQWTKRWVKKHFLRLKKMKWLEIYKEYKILLRQE